MTLPDFRMIVGLTGAKRASPLFGKIKGSNPAAKLGLRYERKVGSELQRHVTATRFVRLERNPWFTFYDAYGVSNCSPDFILHMEDRVIVVEVKLTWVEVALAKLDELYCPVVSCALNCPVLPLVICRNLTASAPPAKFTLSEALMSNSKLLAWPQTGHIIW